MVQIRGLSPGTIVINAYEDLDRTVRFSEVDSEGVFVRWLDVYALTASNGAGNLYGSLSAGLDSSPIFGLTATVPTTPVPATNPGYVKFSATALQTGLLQDPATGAAIESGVLDLWMEIAQVGHEDYGDEKRLGLWRWQLSKSVTKINPDPLT